MQPRGAEAPLAAAHAGPGAELDAVEGAGPVVYGGVHLGLGDQFAAATRP